MRAIGRSEHGRSRRHALLGQPVMHIGRRQQAEPRTQRLPEEVKPAIDVASFTSQ